MKYVIQVILGYIRTHGHVTRASFNFLPGKENQILGWTFFPYFWLHYLYYIIAQRRWCNFIVCQGKCKRYLYTTVLSWRIFWFRVRQPGWGWSKMEHFQCKKPKDLFNFLICGICGMEVDLSLFNINDLGLKLTVATPEVIFDCRAKLGEAI